MSRHDRLAHARNRSPSSAAASWGRPRRRRPARARPARLGIETAQRRDVPRSRPPRRQPHALSSAGGTDAPRLMNGIGVHPLDDGGGNLVERLHQPGPAVLHHSPGIPRPRRWTRPPRRFCPRAGGARSWHPPVAAHSGHQHPDHPGRVIVLERARHHPFHAGVPGIVLLRRRRHRMQARRPPADDDVGVAPGDIDRPPAGIGRLTSTTVSSHARSSRRANAAVKLAGMCCATITGQKPLGQQRQHGIERRRPRSSSDQEHRGFIGAPRYFLDRGRAGAAGGVRARTGRDAGAVN